MQANKNRIIDILKNVCVYLLDFLLWNKEICANAHTWIAPFATYLW